MLPHQFKRLLELLRTQLNAIHEAIQKDTSANHDEHKVAHDEWGKVPGIIASNILGTNDDKAAADAHRKKQESQQDKIIFWARSAFFAAAAYGAIALWQGILMHRTYGEIKTQTVAVECAARAAQQSANNAAQQLFLDTRARIDFAPGETRDDNGHVGVQSIISNPGKIPAEIIKWEYFDVFVRPETEYREPIFKERKDLYEPRNYPAGFISLPSTLFGQQRPASDLKLWEQQKVWDELAIRVTYRFSIDPEHDHVSEACFYLIFGNGAHPQCPHHNGQN